MYLSQLHGDVVEDCCGKDDVLGCEVVRPQHPQDRKSSLPYPEDVLAHDRPKS